jgi:NAD(P)H-hydrate epimerase
LEVEPDIGLVPHPPPSELQWTLGEDFSNYPPPRAVEGHKGTFGHLVIFAGSLGYHGAAVLAARGALQACPGLVTVFTAEDVYLPVASQLQAVMVNPWRPGAPLPETCTAVLFGPGLAAPNLATEFKDELLRLWHELPSPVVADASGLGWLPAKTRPSPGLRVVTPHPGEAGRLLNMATASVQANRPKALMEIARRYGNPWVVLKGYQTMVGSESGPLSINSSGNPLLAQGGSGDVLAGYIGGLLAQPFYLTDPGKALRYGVWEHGAAADLLSAKNRKWTLEDLLRTLGTVARA